MQKSNASLIEAPLNVTYVLKCICGVAYIGQTEPALKLCITEHKAAICSKNTDYAVERHCIEATGVIQFLWSPAESELQTPNYHLSIYFIWIWPIR